MKTIITFLIVLSSFSLLKGQIPGTTEACIDDTVFIPVYFNQLNEYQKICSYNLDYIYPGENFHFLGIDSTQTIIPPDGLSITLSDYNQEASTKLIEITTNSNSQSLFSVDNEAGNMVTLKFKSDLQHDAVHTSALITRDNNNDILASYNLSDTVIVYNNILEIYEMPTLNLHALSFSATRGYENYTWSYRKKYTWNTPYGDLHYSGADVYFNGHGIYSVTANDEHGCRLSDEHYFQIDAMPGIRFESSQQVNIPDTFSVAVTSMCVYYSCLAEDFTINSVNFDFEYEPQKLTFDECLFDSTIFPDGYFKGYTIDEIKIDENFSNLKISLLIDESQPGFEYVEYAVGDFMKINFIPQADGATEIGMPYVEINGEQAVTSTIRQSVEILPGEEIGNYAKGTVTAGGSPYNEGVVIAYLKTQDQYNEVEQTNIDNGKFEFPATLTDGEYVFCAVPGDNGGYLTTYYGNKQTIDSAFVIDLNDCDGVVALNIEMIPNTVSTGMKSFNTSSTATNNLDFDLYPNPVTDLLTIQLQPNKNSDQDINITLFNIYGEKIYTIRNPEKSSGDSEFLFSIDMYSYPQGIYFIKIGNVSKMFFKQ